MRDYRDEYEGARADLLVWKGQALRAEAKVREYEQRIIDIGAIAINSISRESHIAAMTALQSELSAERIKREAAERRLSDAPVLCACVAKTFCMLATAQTLDKG